MKRFFFFFDECITKFALKSDVKKAQLNTDEVVMLKASSLSLLGKFHYLYF